MQIPTINTCDIKDADLTALMKIGFCYVELPNKAVTENIRKCMQAARDFFQTSQAEKAKWQLKENLAPGDRYEGYALRSQSKNTNAIEQIFFEPASPFGPYQSEADTIQDINITYMKQIFLPIIAAIFKKINLSSANLNEITQNPYCSLVFQSCPNIGEHESVIRLNAHKDFGLLTILYFEEPGLEVNYLSEWKAIPPKKDCVVVNLGNALELMTNGCCHSALHRVTNATENRISTVFFINPNYHQPVMNYVTNTLISQNGEMFFKQQFAEYYQVEY